MFSSVLHNAYPVRNGGAPQGAYLTDELNLYRVLGTLEESQTLVLVEDCRTLDVIMIDATTATGLRRVEAHAALA